MPYLISDRDQAALLMACLTEAMERCEYVADDASKDARIAELTALAERRLAVIVELLECRDFLKAGIAFTDRMPRAWTAPRAEVEAAKVPAPLSEHGTAKE